MFFDRGTFLGTPIHLLLSSQKRQGVPLSPICQNSFLLQRPHQCCPHLSATNNNLLLLLLLMTIVMMIHLMILVIVIIIVLVISVDPICPQPISQDSSKGCAVETGCSGLHYIIYCCFNDTTPIHCTPIHCNPL